MSGEAEARLAGSLGAPVASWTPGDLPGTVVTLSVDDAVLATGQGSAALGNPFDAVLWLVEALAQRGEGIAAGEVVITGTCTGVTPLAPGASVRADFGRYGTVACTLAAAEATAP